MITPLLTNLLDELTAAGRLQASWRPAFERVHRHLFVPDRAWLLDGGRRIIDRTADSKAWLTAAYSDEPIVTQWSDGAADGDDPTAQATSSLSMPTMVATMLAALDVDAGDHVLEIGTGSGWSSALLAARLGGDHVVTIEIDPRVAAVAQASLDDAGAHPTLVIGDGALGYPPAAPYDRVIATCSVSTIPYEWIAQTRPGGRVVVPWNIPLINGLLLGLDVAGDGTASGRFLDTAVFMSMRSQRPAYLDVPIDPDTAPEPTPVDPWEPLNGDHAQFAVGLLVPSCYEWTEVDEAGVVWQRIDDPISGSWATIPIGFREAGLSQVRQGGPRRLWDEITAAYTWWQDAGSPVFTRFGINVTPAGGETVYLDQPDHVVHAPGS